MSRRGLFRVSFRLNEQADVFGTQARFTQALFAQACPAAVAAPLWAVAAHFGHGAAGSVCSRAAGQRALARSTGGLRRDRRGYFADSSALPSLARVVSETGFPHFTSSANAVFVSAGAAFLGPDFLPVFPQPICRSGRAAARRRDFGCGRYCRAGGHSKPRSAGSRFRAASRRAGCFDGLRAAWRRQTSNCSRGLAGPSVVRRVSAAPPSAVPCPLPCARPADAAAGRADGADALRIRLGGIAAPFCLDWRCHIFCCFRAFVSSSGKLLLRNKIAPSKPEKNLSISCRSRNHTSCHFAWNDSAAPWPRTIGGPLSDHSTSGSKP